MPWFQFFCVYYLPIVGRCKIVRLSSDGRFFLHVITDIRKFNQLIPLYFLYNDNPDMFNICLI
jgi:hypothetical protein